MEVLKIAATIILSVGVSGGIIAGLANWLGRVWANRLMEKDRSRHAEALENLRANLQAENEKRMRQLQSEIDIFNEKHLKAHHDKLATYRMGADIIASILTDLERFGEGRGTPEEVGKIKDRFTNERIRLYAYLGMIAPQSVMDAQDSLIDYLLMIMNGRANYQWEKVRELSLNFLNEVRKDIGIDKTNIEYRVNFKICQKWGQLTNFNCVCYSVLSNFFFPVRCIKKE